MGNFSITISGHSAFITSKLWRFNNEIEYANVGGVDHVAVALYVDGFAGMDDAFGHIGFVVES